MHIDLPGGASAELRDAESLTGADQDKYADAVDAALEVRRREAEAAAIAANPAMMPDPSAPPPRARLTNADMRGLRDMVLGEMITAWSFPIALPYNSAARAQLPIYACNALQEAISAHVDALNGESGPKEATTAGSATTSSGESSSPLPAAPPAS